MLKNNASSNTVMFVPVHLHDKNDAASSDDHCHLHNVVGTCVHDVVW